MTKKITYTQDGRAFYSEGEHEPILYLNGKELRDEIDVSLASDGEWKEIKKDPWDKKKLKKFSI